MMYGSNGLSPPEKGLNGWGSGVLGESGGGVERYRVVRRYSLRRDRQGTV